ncbi:heavy-metal-associated domain-containing protein, partial [Klebsiella pneumoniae]
MSQLHFQVEGMSCQGCASSIEKALIKHAKVKKASVDFNKKELNVDGDVPSAEIASIL